jgi:pimeloyl-ACP methyl ester carboxylesterase
VQTLAETTTTCAYSRAGGYGSTPVEGLLTREVIVHDAFTLVERLHQQHGVPGPYLLVGWSFGGSVILAEALAHPELTAGLVVLDNNFTVDYVKVCTASGRRERECRKSYDEDKEAKSIEKDIADRVHPLPDISITEVSAMHLDDCSTAPGADSVSYEAAGVVLTAPDCESLATKIAKKNFRDWRQLGPQVQELRVEATHDGLINEAGPEIITIIKDVLGR